ncbi:MAG: hypothetical protein LBV41_05515, partial [Cytophagaceae bacterium]|nr:hypothetical protein [Cytophagaceae bacterium]
MPTISTPIRMYAIRVINNRFIIRLLRKIVLKRTFTPAQPFILTRGLIPLLIEMRHQQQWG